tara:strand:+ start:5562 stop:6599 length:1038 start_codon:yes stop_codon:yes gene_type:complete
MQYPHFTDKHQSLMAKYLTKDVFSQLENIISVNGFSLHNAINSGLQNPDSNIGVYAGDLASYTCFAPLFDPIIRDYHGTESSALHSTNLNPEQVNAINPDPNNEYIVSTRIRVGRNLADMPLGTAISKEQRDEVENRVVKALTQLTGSLSGDYYRIQGMAPSVQERLINDHFLFKAGDQYLEAAGLNRDWPSGRGIYHNDQKTFLVWVNEEDQLRIISMQPGGDIKQVFHRLTLALAQLEKHLSFLFSPRLGFISSCPTNLGTAMRASVHIKLPYLGKHRAEFNAITQQHHLQIRGLHGEHSESEGDIYDVSNSRRLGVTEVQCVQDLYTGVVALIAKEKQLSSL